MHHKVEFELPLYPDRHVLSGQALDDLERLMNTGCVPMTLGADGPRVGTVRSARRRGAAVECVAYIDDSVVDVIAGVGLDVRVPHREDKRHVPSIAEAPAAIVRTADELQPGARKLGAVTRGER